jgi:hypothetical protein
MKPLLLIAAFAMSLLGATSCCGSKSIEAPPKATYQAPKV